MVKELILNQTKTAYNWVNQIIDQIPENSWDNMAKNVETNVTWQVGHLIMSFYYHSVMVIKGHDMDVLASVPMMEYTGIFSYASNSSTCIGNFPADKLKSQLKLLQEISLKTISEMSEEDFQSALNPTGPKHPIANTKLEALEWNIQHTMWHCGQLAILKRLSGERLHFNIEN